TLNKVSGERGEEAFYICFENKWVQSMWINTIEYINLFSIRKDYIIYDLNPVKDSFIEEAM
ncbi:TPA: hypothetical protein ACJHB2_005071, partial [Escherichia coli]